MLDSNLWFWGYALVDSAGTATRASSFLGSSLRSTSRTPLRQRNAFNEDFVHYLMIVPDNNAAMTY